ncbi:MAG: hypothetical protein WBD55_07320 [Dehalococcoidia bacterium]
MTGKPLEKVIARLRRRSPDRGDELALTSMSPTAFRAVVDERLRSLEHQLDEVKGRVNGLIFLLAGTVTAQLILRLVDR